MELSFNEELKHEMLVLSYVEATASASEDTEALEWREEDCW